MSTVTVRRVLMLIATGGGVGFFPLLPGTVGTAMAIPLYLVLSRIGRPGYELSVFGFFLTSIWICDKVGQILGKEDDPRIVIDEIVGFLIATLWTAKGITWIGISFFLFRFFDILKPPPIGLLEKLKGGYGVVLDDVMAGIYANLTLRLMASLWAFFGKLTIFISAWG